MNKVESAASLATAAHGGLVIVLVDGYDVIDCQACGFRHIDPLFSDEDLQDCA